MAEEKKTEKTLPDLKKPAKELTPEQAEAAKGGKKKGKPRK